MKFIQESHEKTKVELIEEYMTTINHIVVFVFLSCMLGVFPLYYKEQYNKIGDAKFDFFWMVSLGFIAITLVIFCVKMILSRMRKTKSNGAGQKKKKTILGIFLDNLSGLDYAVFIYAICVLLSYLYSDFKEFAWKGAPGWEMGLCSQLIFVAIYFILSRQNLLESIFPSKKKMPKKGVVLRQRNYVIIILVIHLVSSVLTFIFGILHRFDIDPLGMYVGLDIYQKIEFLSTIGQATWFSSYVCTVFAVGVTIFYTSRHKGVRIMTGIYSALSFGILVTQNSDSAFIAIMGVMLLLGYLSLSDREKWCRFWEIICLMWGTFGGIGILQRIFAERRIPLDSLSVFFSQSVITWVMFAVSIVLMLFYKYGCKSDILWKRITKEIYEDMVLCIVAAVIVISVFIYLNTKGYLLKWFGYQSMHPYLFFDYHWGSNRGSTWMVCWQAFTQMPLYQKLFGVGPDSLWAYFNSVPEIKDFLYSLWGSLRVTNAHNEYLNGLLCYGIVGVSAWLAVLIGGIVHFYNRAKENPFMIAFALCIMGYACHNIFCYQQVCCTPFLFLALGIGESLTKSENFNTIK